MASRPPRKEFTADSVLFPSSPPEVIAVAKSGIMAPALAAPPALGEDVELVPLFGSPQRLFAAAEAARAEGAPAPDLSKYFRVKAPESKVADVASALRQQPGIDAVYIKPPTTAAHMAGIGLERLNTMLPAPADAPPVTPDFTPRQGYLGPAPAGVDAHYAWTLAGGRGTGVRVIDIEGAWRFSHEDLLENQGGLAGGTEFADVGWRNHGTAVIGVISADQNGVGVTGISPDAHIRGVAIGTIGSAAAIKRAADMLSPGDIILIELHRAGPRHNFQPRADQAGYVAIEWWPDDYEAILYATSRGIIVVEAAGNGAENLDDALYDANPAAPNGPFPGWWKNPYRRHPHDSGAIVIGAGAPPPGTHGQDHGPDRSRLGFSNYGAFTDAQGWGREVTTCGYGDLQGGANEDEWYTDRFSGTSSASPVVVGTLACLQGFLKARHSTPLRPAMARNLLRSTGSPQQDAPGRPMHQRIGNRPDLRQLVTHLREPKPGQGIQFSGTVPASSTRQWMTSGWPADLAIAWSVVPTTQGSNGPQLETKVQVEKTGDGTLSYWISVTNLTSADVDFESRYVALNG